MPGRCMQSTAWVLTMHGSYPAVCRACPSCGYSILEGPDIRPYRPPTPRPWHLVDRIAVKAYIGSLSVELTEKLLALFVDERRHLLSVETIGHGTVDKLEVNIRLIFHRALQTHAAAFLLIHNHPSGDARPSQSDIIFTLRVRELGQQLGIPMLDHFIIAGANLRAID